MSNTNDTRSSSLATIAVKFLDEHLCPVGSTAPHIHVKRESMTLVTGDHYLVKYKLDALLDGDNECRVCTKKCYFWCQEDFVQIRACVMDKGWLKWTLLWVSTISVCLFHDTIDERSVVSSCSQAGEEAAGLLALSVDRRKKRSIIP
jgi:hypothetical protein